MENAPPSPRSPTPDTLARYTHPEVAYASPDRLSAPKKNGKKKKKVKNKNGKAEIKISIITTLTTTLKEIDEI